MEFLILLVVLVLAGVWFLARLPRGRTPRHDIVEDRAPGRD